METDKPTRGVRVRGPWDLGAGAAVQGPADGHTPYDAAIPLRDAPTTELPGTEAGAAQGSCVGNSRKPTREGMEE